LSFLFIWLLRHRIFTYMQIVTATLIASINIKASAAYVTTQQRKLATTTHIDSTLGVSTF